MPSLIREYQPAYILSVLRIRCYIEAERPRPGADVVDQRLAQQELLRSGTTRFELVMTEAALRWNVGGREIMDAQLAHIRDVAGRDGIDLGIIPTGTPVNFFAGHAFHIYDDSAVMVGTLTDRRTYSDPESVTAYLSAFARLKQVAVFGGRCLDLIADIRSTLQ